MSSCAYGNVVFQPSALAAGSKNVTFKDAWTLNTDDLNWGVHVVNIQGTATP